MLNFNFFARSILDPWARYRYDFLFSAKKNYKKIDNWLVSYE